MRVEASAHPGGRYAFFGLAALSLMMFSIDSTIVAVAIPSMMLDLQTSVAWIGWTLTAYMLVQTAMMPLAGKLSETFGRVRVFTACVLLFTLGSLLCGLAPNVYLLILFRVLQALGGAGFLPSAVGIVAKEFPENRDRMVGLFSSIFPLGGVIGPNVGGFIIQHASWRMAFLVNVPIGLLVLAALLSRLRRPEERKQQPIDLLGAALYGSAIVSLLLALTLLGQDPGLWRGPLFWIPLAASLGFLATFVWHERRVRAPVIDLALVARNPFLAVNVYNFLFGAGFLGFFSFVPYYAVVQFHMTPFESGAVLTPRSLAMIVTAAAASLFLIRLGYRLPMLVGLLLVVASLLLLSLGLPGLRIGAFELSAFWLVALEMMLAGIGMGLSTPASNNAALDLAPGRAAVITGIRGMFRSTGGVVGTALVVLGIALSPDKAAGMRLIFTLIAAVLLLTLPLVFLIPDTARMRRLRGQQPAGRAGPSPAAHPVGTGESAALARSRGADR